MFIYWNKHDVNVLLDQKSQNIYQKRTKKCNRKVMKPKSTQKCKFTQKELKRKWTQKSKMAQESNQTRSQKSSQQSKITQKGLKQINVL